MIRFETIPLQKNFNSMSGTCDNGGMNFTLEQIARWAEGNKEVEIPALQRGIVWKPKQVEMLWDSLLRGFPIGGFILSDIPNQKGRYYLLDGQQRYNAISLGYNMESIRTVLWLDIEPKKEKNSTRTFFVKCTTLAQPWGFQNDDACSILNTKERGDALEKFGLNGNIYNTSFSLSKTWPYKAQKPIPLYCFLKASTASPEVFYENVIELFRRSKFDCREEILATINENENYIKTGLFKAFRMLHSYTIGCAYLSQDIMKKETNTSTQEATSLEILFTRLNTGGTRISQDDLNYSAIKAYWPEIKENNDKLAKEYMSPSKLAMLAFRLALTEDKNEDMKGELSIKHIRSVAQQTDKKEKELVIKLYAEDNLKKILSTIDDWLGVSGTYIKRTPAVLRTSIAQKSPDVYLLLMYLAQKAIRNDYLFDTKYIKALAFTLHWFYANNKHNAVREIFKSCSRQMSIENVLKGISQAQHDCNILPIYTPEEMQRFISIKCDKKWSIRGNNDDYGQWIHFFDRIFWYGSTEAKEMLLYAQREYINTKFSKYDTAMQGLWEDYNRPWDFDHITPQDWISNKRGEYRDFDKQWLNSIGNIAAISYEINRRKGNREDYEEYHKYSEYLLYNYDSETINRDISYNSQASEAFANITYKRACDIYSRIYDIISCLFETTELPERLSHRKQLFESIKQQLPNATIWFAADNEIEYEVIREQDWVREWIGVGLVKEDFYVCLEWPASENPHYEIGIRKAPSIPVKEQNRELFYVDDITKRIGDGYNNNKNSWWYICKEVPVTELNADNIIKEMSLLRDIIDDIILPKEQSDKQ